MRRNTNVAEVNEEDAMQSWHREQDRKRREQIQFQVEEKLNNARRKQDDITMVEGEYQFLRGLADRAGVVAIA